MDLYILSHDIELQGVIDSYRSLRWRRRYFEPGEFELHCSATAENIVLLQEGNVIHRLDRDEAGIIESVKIDTPDDGTGDEITVSGRMGSSMLDQRIITQTINFSGTVEDAMRKIVSDNAITVRPIFRLVLGTADGFTPICSFQATGKNILTVCEALGKAAPLGFRIRLDVPNKQWVFKVYDGTDHSVAQSVNPWVVFSGENENIEGASYVKDTTGFKNFAYVAGEGEGPARTVATVDQTGGKPRRELWVDAKDLTSKANAEDDFIGDGSTTAYTLSHAPTDISSATVGGTSMSDYTLSGSMVTFTTAPASGAAIAINYSYTLSIEEYTALLTQRGLEKLADAVKSESFSADAVDTENFQYLTDWNLGDIVSFERWGILLNQRITEVEEVYENGVETITPTCGSPLPETLDLGVDT